MTINPDFCVSSRLAILLMLFTIVSGYAHSQDQTQAQDPIQAQSQMQTHTLSDTTSPRLMMENPDNPLLVIQSSQGDIHLELFPDAAPQNVQRVLQLANAELPVPQGTDNNPQTLHYYDGMTFHRVIPGTLIQTGAPEQANRQRPVQSVPDEINGRALSLEQQRLFDPEGRPHPWMNIRNQADLQENILLPLYRSMDITNRADLTNRQQSVLQRLQQMNLLQAYENLGYRYNPGLPSRRPTMGSVMMVNNGPGQNDGEFFITLEDTPWLTATHTVIGRVVSGLPIATQISRNPAASVRIYQVRQSGIDVSNVSEGDNNSGTNNP